jgi:hypothetical protein
VTSDYCHCGVTASLEEMPTFCCFHYERKPQQHRSWQHNDVCAARKPTGTMGVSGTVHLKCHIHSGRKDRCFKRLCPSYRGVRYIRSKRETKPTPVFTHRHKTSAVQRAVMYEGQGTKIWQKETLSHHGDRFNAVTLLSDKTCQTRPPPGGRNGDHKKVSAGLLTSALRGEFCTP